MFELICRRAQGIIFDKTPLVDNQYLQVVLDDEGNDEQELVEVIRAPEQDLAGTPFKWVHLRTPLKK